MPTDHLDHPAAALLRYLYDDRRSKLGMQRLLDMGMVTAREVVELLTELRQKGLIRTTLHSGVSDAHITDKGIAWVRAHYADA